MALDFFSEFNTCNLFDFIFLFSSVIFCVGIGLEEGTSLRCWTEILSLSSGRFLFLADHLSSHTSPSPSSLLLLYSVVLQIPESGFTACWQICRTCSDWWQALRYVISARLGFSSLAVQFCFLDISGLFLGSGQNGGSILAVKQLLPWRQSYGNLTGWRNLRSSGIDAPRMWSRFWPPACLAHVLWMHVCSLCARGYYQDLLRKWSPGCGKILLPADLLAWFL